MDGPAPAAPHRPRPIAVILWCALAACAALIIALVLWAFLPRWCPMAVVRWSPWVDPALRATTQDQDALEHFLERVHDWGPGAARCLGRVLRTGDDRERLVACQGLREIRPLPAEPVADLVAAIHDQLPRVRRQALAVLAANDAPELGDELMRMLGSDDDLLDDLDVRNELNGLMYDDHGRPDAQRTDQAIALARSPRPTVRVRALRLLYDLDLPGAHLAIVGALDDPDAAVRATAIDGAGSARIGWAIAPLMALFAAHADPADPADADLRLRVVRALGAIGERAALPVVVRACADPAVAVRRCAVTALVAIRDGSQGAVLLDLARDQDGQLAALARQALVTLRVAGADEVFLAELAHADPARRDEAIRALVSLQGDRLLDLLVARARDGDAGIRVGVARGLGGCGDPRAVAPLLAMLDDADSLVRWNAALAAGQYVDPRIADALIAALLDGRLQPDAQALRRSKSPDQDPARWHNAVLNALAVQDLSAAQRGRMPARRSEPPPAEGLASPPQADVDQPIPQTVRTR